MNGWKSWASWNVSLWIDNTESLYNLYSNYMKKNVKKKTKKELAKDLISIFYKNGFFETPDGARVTERSLSEIVNTDYNDFVYYS